MHTAGENFKFLAVSGLTIDHFFKFQGYFWNFIMDICPIFPEFQGKSDFQGFQGEWGSYKNFDFHLD